MYYIGITIHITVKGHNASISSFHTSAFHHLGFVCGVLEARNTFPTLITKLELQYPVFEKRWSLNGCKYRKVFSPDDDLENHTSGGQIADPGVPLWSIMLALLHRVPLRIRGGFL